ncbi:hypothetical protein [Mucilaginibacter myungsuensis]|uniref:Lipoprotein n=1 Tax=Mucilaginibacter myungsuensis TaxID=649104 RepID=A0A929L2T7_9SPHI|nr:hypothetical protein [Mucilaginibacter myungsuensis]MBE9663045.1 hypothetical protein [Mucilaginibacter myungsuensis]MDN3598679.1 hypothetical protein [Mucilaginibacter myungsuensis]
MKIFAMLLFVIAGSYGCANDTSNDVHKRIIYNAHGLKVITSFSNRKQQTISILYGNALALQSAKTGIHDQGEVFELVTFKQADNKFWYGSYINGAVQSIELVTSYAKDKKVIDFNYKIVQGQVSGGADARINSITSHRALLFP